LGGDGEAARFAYGALTPCGAPFQALRLTRCLVTPWRGWRTLLVAPTTPGRQRRQALPPPGFGLVPVRSPLLGESLLLSSPGGTEMFQFPPFPPPALCVQAGVTWHSPRRVSPFGDPWINAWSTAPHGLSQSPTSFIGSRRQGIHRWPFVPWSCDTRARSGVLKLRGWARRGHQCFDSVRPPSVATP